MRCHPPTARTAEMTELRANGLTFNAHVLGDGDPVVVLIHGLVLDNLSSWYFSIGPALAATCTVLLYDLRGHGGSEQPPTGYTIEDMAEDLHGILEAAGLAGRPLVVVGNSTGGLIGLRYVLRYPRDVASLVLIDAHVAHSEFGQQMATTLGLEGEELRDKLHELFGNGSTATPSRARPTRMLRRPCGCSGASAAAAGTPSSRARSSSPRTRRSSSTCATRAPRPMTNCAPSRCPCSLSTARVRPPRRGRAHRRPHPALHARSRPRHEPRPHLAVDRDDPPPPGYLGRWTLSYGTTVTLALAVAPRWLTVT